MLSDKQNGLLRDILDSAAMIRSYLNGVSQNAFMSNPEKQDAVLRRFEIIGEASSHQATQKSRCLTIYHEPPIFMHL